MLLRASRVLRGPAAAAGLAALVAGAACGGNITRVAELHVPEGSTDTRDKEIRRRERGTFTFARAGVTVDDDFPGGAFTAAAETAGGVELTIAPENSPINDSAWFAFRVVATGAPHDVTVTLRYEGGTHRYHPKVSTDGHRFARLADDALSVAADGSRATIRLRVDGTPRFVAAQELVTAEGLAPWLEGLAARPFVRRETIGASAGGRPLVALHITEATGPRSFLIVLGRQHPPEVTGTLALIGFVDALCGDGERARAFRRRFETVVIPMVNPDGVADGHWRHNLHGVDLNRDWAFFRQPETRAVRDALAGLAGAGVAFAVDFHSTYEDVFYVLPDALDASSTSLAARWITALAARLPGYRYRVQAVTPDVPAASPWLARTFGVPAVTYEVGDETPRPDLERLAGAAADELMRLLLEAPPGVETDEGRP